MKKKLLALTLCTLFSGATLAGPADYVYMPSAEYGEKEIDFKTGSAESPTGETKKVSSLGFGLGATEHWFTEVYLKTESVTGEPRLNILELENKFQLTETGKYPLEIGLITELEFPLNRDGEAKEYKFGPLFQTDFGKIQLNGNILFERAFGGDSEEAHETVLQYQWQTKYRLKKEFEFGLQGFGEMGKWNDWAPGGQQEHKIGPAIFGKLATGDHQAFKYNAAWLRGLSNATANNTFRLQAEYEF